MFEHPALGPVLKALAAAAAGRTLLMIYARSYRPLSLPTLAVLLAYEIPIVCAFALLGWNAASLMGLETDNEKIVATILLSHFGKIALDALLERILGPRLNTPSDDGR